MFWNCKVEEAGEGRLRWRDGVIYAFACACSGAHLTMGIVHSSVKENGVSHNGSFVQTRWSLSLGGSLWDGSNSPICSKKSFVCYKILLLFLVRSFLES